MAVSIISLPNIDQHRSNRSRGLESDAINNCLFLDFKIIRISASRHEVAQPNWLSPPSRPGLHRICGIPIFRRHLGITLDFRLFKQLFDRIAHVPSERFYFLGCLGALESLVSRFYSNFKSTFQGFQFPERQSIEVRIVVHVFFPLKFSKDRMDG